MQTASRTRHEMAQNSMLKQTDIIKAEKYLKITEKSLIQHCERSELRLHFEWTKVNEKCQKWSIWQVF